MKSAAHVLPPSREMNIESDVMSDSMRKIFAEPLPVQIFAVRVDVVIRDFVKRIGRGLTEGHARLHGGDCGLLRAQHDLVNFFLPRGEMAVDRQRTRDVGGIHRVFGGGINHDDVSGLHRGSVFRVVQNRGTMAGAYDRRIRGALAAAAGPFVLHHR